MTSDTLDSLNSTGKMIEIIFHVDVLKERIAVQLAITKKGGLVFNTLSSRLKKEGNHV